MDKVQGLLDGVSSFAQQHPRAVKGVATATGATVGCFIATSKLGLLAAAAAGVVFATVAGAVTGRIIGEVIAREYAEYIPPAE